MKNETKEKMNELQLEKRQVSLEYVLINFSIGIPEHHKFLGQIKRVIIELCGFISPNESNEIGTILMDDLLMEREEDVSFLWENSIRLVEHIGEETDIVYISTESKNIFKKLVQDLIKRRS